MSGQVGRKVGEPLTYRLMESVGLGGPKWHGSSWQRGIAESGRSRLSTLMIDVPGDLVWDLPCVQQASYLEGGPLMWMLPLYLHVNQKSDYLHIYQINWPCLTWPHWVDWAVKPQNKKINMLSAENFTQNTKWKSQWKIYWAASIEKRSSNVQNAQIQISLRMRKVSRRIIHSVVSK